MFQSKYLPNQNGFTVSIASGPSESETFLVSISYSDASVGSPTVVVQAASSTSSTILLGNREFENSLLLGRKLFELLNPAEHVICLCCIKEDFTTQQVKMLVELVKSNC